MPTITCQKFEVPAPLARIGTKTESDMTKQIKTVRGATGEVRFFETREEALRHCLRRGDFNELWRIEE